MIERPGSGVNSTMKREYQALQVAIQQIERLTEEQFMQLDQEKATHEAQAQHEQHLTDTISRLNDEVSRLRSELSQHDYLYASEYQARSQFYENLAQAPITDESLVLTQLIRERDCKAVVVYPAAVQWEPMQRPQQLLIELARRGYLCFFCNSEPEFSYREVENGLYIVSNETHLLQALQSTHVLVLNTWLMQNAWIDHLPHKTIWYDVLDRVDFFGLYDRNMLAKHYQLLHTADLVTYSARQLKEYVIERTDAVYLPNAARPEDFRGVTRQEQVPVDLESILDGKSKIIGYFGAIEEWFDVALVNRLAAQSGIKVVLIGHCGIASDRFSDNIYLLGPKPYAELRGYAAYFDALIIPFIVNTLTNAVSPVKFFEYCAIGKPIITTPIAEVLPFRGPGITIVQPNENVRLHASFWQMTNKARHHLRAIADSNRWEARAEVIEREMAARPSCLNIFANMPVGERVTVFTATFLDYDGANYYSGGAERYLVDLHEVFDELGIRMDIYQYGNYPWYRKYKDIDVYSLGHDGLDMQSFSMDTLTRFNRRYLYAAENSSVLNVYSAFFQAFPTAAQPSIGISHGVAWDHPGCEYEEGNSFWNSNARFIDSATMVQQMVSVDTNTPNWFQTVAYRVGHQMVTIPNYVDPNEFHPVSKQQDGKVRIVYPRRLYEPRGLYITLAVIDEILEKYPNVEFHFVGKGFDHDIEQINKVIERWEGRVFCYHRNPDEMHLVYQMADITLIPTLYSEGTSLSCLEACATGNAVIATRVGGLTDIIIDRYNGLLINADSAALRSAIIECLDNAELREELGRNALMVSKAFNKGAWKERWKQVIRQVLSQNASSAPGRAFIQTVELKVSDSAGGEWLKQAIMYLKQGKAVFIRTPDAARRETSYGRLQWISDDEELYFQPLISKDFRSGK